MSLPDVFREFSGKKVLVTGGTGLIGREVVDFLVESGARVCVVSLDRLKLRRDVSYIYGDLTDFAFCRKALRGMDFVCHLAGIKGSIEMARTRLASHFVPTLMMNVNVLEACRLNGVQKVVYTSSIGAYADSPCMREEEYRLDTQPMDFAGWAKRMAELQIHAYHVQFGAENFAVVRPSNVYGPGDNFDPANAMVVPSLMRRIYEKEDPLVIWGDGGAVRDFVFSRDAAEGILLALVYGTRGSFVNLGSGQGVSIRQLVETLHEFIDFRYTFDASKPCGFPRRVMDIARAREWIHYEPRTSLREGLQETWEWFLKHPDEFRKKQNYFTQKQ